MKDDKAEKAEQEYRRTVLKNQDEYPNLAELEKKRNKYRFSG